MPVIAQNLVVALTALALLFYIGLGLSAWLPGSLQAYRWLLTPWVGYSLLVVTTQFLTNIPGGLTALQSSNVVLALATVINLYALARARGPSAAPLAYPVIWGLAALTFVLGVLPLWSYGFSTVIGENWDAEIYMGLGEYLKQYAQSGLTSALPNPILDTLINPPYSLRTHGFSYLHAALGILPLDSLRTMAPLLALVRALSIPAAYVFFKVGLNLHERAARVGTAALALNAFLLWVTYNTFGMQVPTFGLLPVAACLLLVTVREAANASGRSIASALWLGLFLAAIAITYHPALTAFAAMAAPVVIVVLITQASSGRWRRIIVSLVVAGASGAVLSAVSQMKSLDGFLKQYGEKTAGLGLTGFTAPGDAWGFSLSFRDLFPAGPGQPLVSLVSKGYAALGWAALVVALALVGLYIRRLWRAGDAGITWEQIALLGGAVAYALLFLRPLDYPYGWFKALSFVSFVVVGMSAGGLITSAQPAAEGSLARSRERPRLAGARRALYIGAGLLVATPLLATLWLTLAYYVPSPIRFDRAMMEVGSARAAIESVPPGERAVYVASGYRVQRLGRLFNGLVSYFLRDTDLYGSFSTANSKLDHIGPSGLYRFTLLHADDNPWDYGVGNEKVAWRNSLMALYEAPPGGERQDMFHVNFGDSGKYPQVDASHSYTPTFGGPSSSDGELQASFGLASFDGARLRIGNGNVDVPPGYSIYRTPAYVAGENMSVAAVEGSAYVRWAHLERQYAPLSGPAGISPDETGLLATVSARQDGGTIDVAVRYMNNEPGVNTQTLSLDIYGTGAAHPHFGYWNVNVSAHKPVSFTWSLKPARKTMTAEPSSAYSQGEAFAGPTGDGEFTASLLVYQGGQVAETFNDVCRFTLVGGRLSAVKPRSLPPLFRQSPFRDAAR